MACRGTPQYHPCILTTPPLHATPATHTLAPSPWQAVDDSSRDEETWAAALGDKVDSRTGLVRKARRMSGAERRKHSKQANNIRTLIIMDMLTRAGTG